MEGVFPARAEKAEIERTIKKGFSHNPFFPFVLSNNEGKSGVFFRNIPIQVIHIPMHTAVIIPTDRQFLKHDLFRQKDGDNNSCCQMGHLPFVKLDAFVKHQQLKLPLSLNSRHGPTLFSQKLTSAGRTALSSCRQRSKRPFFY